jgi:uncharacterized damage-inducible protein DinB
MYTTEALLDLHERSHRSLQKLLEHCSQFKSEELNRELAGFGYPTIRLQFHHEIGAEEYWIGVLQGRVFADDNDAAYPTIKSLEDYRQRVYQVTDKYLITTPSKELNTARKMMTWGNKEKILTPALVYLRTMTHLFHHQGQILAMCRLLGKPGSGMDFPIN